MITEKLKRFWHKYMSRGNVLHFALGRLLNPLKVPGLMRPGNYGDQDTRVSVRVDKLWAIVSVNGTGLYFRRLTGTFDGIAHSTPIIYKEESTPQPVRLDEPPASFQQNKSHMQNS
jgi:hypothetical protein